MAKHKMHGLAGLKEDAMEIASTGAGVVAGVAVAKAVTGWIEEQPFLKEESGEAKKWAPYASAAVPVAVGLGVLWGADKAKLAGHMKKAAVGVAAGMAAVAIGKVFVALAPDTAKTLRISGLGEVDTYDSGLLAGLGMYDASVNRYMMAGSPTQVQTLSGAPIQVKALAGAPTQVQMLAGAPMSATLM